MESCGYSCAQALIVPDHDNTFMLVNTSENCAAECGGKRKSPGSLRPESPQPAKLAVPASPPGFDRAWLGGRFTSRATVPLLGEQPGNAIVAVSDDCRCLQGKRLPPLKAELSRLLRR